MKYTCFDMTWFIGFLLFIENNIKDLALLLLLNKRRKAPLFSKRNLSPDCGVTEEDFFCLFRPSWMFLMSACLRSSTTTIIMFRSSPASSSHWIFSFFCSEHELFMFSFSVRVIHCEGGYFGILPPHPHLLSAIFTTQPLTSWRNGDSPRFTHVPELFTDRPYFIGMSTGISWANADDDISCGSAVRLPRNGFANEFSCFISHENRYSWRICTCDLNLWVIVKHHDLCNKIVVIQ